MIAHDLALWTAGLEKVDAGVPELLTNAEWVILMYYGGEDIFRRRETLRSAATKSSNNIETAVVKAVLHGTPVPLTVRPE